MKKKQKLGKYEKGIIITGVAVLIIFLILLTADGIKNMGKNNNNLALSEQEEVVPPNAPVLSAGMIPVKYEGENLIICKNDNSWYNYENGTPAYMMLNDGVHQSELVVDMTGKKLASEHIGQTVQAEEQGTIYMWIPRFTKNIKTKEIKYIEPEINLGGEWEISDTFVHKQIYDERKPDYSLSGIWIEKEPLANTAEVNTKVSNMTGEENKYGFIANTVGIAEDWVIKTTIEEYSKNDVGAQAMHNEAVTRDARTATIICTQENLVDIENMNRTIIKVINDKHYEPIKARIAYNETAGTIEIAVTYNKNGIQKIEDKNGNSVAYSDENGIIKATVPVKAGKNHFTIIDNKNNKKELEVTVALPIYAKLYTDGTLALTNADKTISGKTVANKYGDITSKSGQPWFNEKESIITVDIVDEIAPLSMYSWFDYCKNLSEIKNINNLDTSNVTSMSNVFRECNSLTELDLNSFDTSSVTDMYAMFYNCNNLTSLNLSSFNTSNVTSMWSMFYGCSKLTKLDVSNFDTSSVSGPNMINMFLGCSSLTELDLSNFNTSKVTNMTGMFNSCSSLTKLNVSSFDTSNVEYMTVMFIACSNLTELDLSNFNTSKVIDVGSMFQMCSSLKQLDVSNFDTSNVTSMAGMFCLCNSLTELNVSNFDTSNVAIISSMFSQCSSLTKLDVSKFNTSKVTNMAQMFSQCNSLTELDISNFDTSKVANMSSMFEGCSKLTKLDVSNLETSNVTDMRGMFSGCSNLTKLDISNFDTSKVANMSSMFSGCSNLINLDVSNLNTSNVTNIGSMFAFCSSLTSLDLTNFNTSKVTDMNSMFQSCKSLTSINVSNFNTTNVTSMWYMFSNCSSLTNLNLRSFNTNKVTNMAYMFYNCSNLTKIYVGYNWKEASYKSGMFSGCGTNSVTK